MFPPSRHRWLRTHYAKTLVLLENVHGNSLIEGPLLFILAALRASIP